MTMATARVMARGGMDLGVPSWPAMAAVTLAISYIYLDLCLYLDLYLELYLELYLYQYPVANTDNRWIRPRQR